MSRIPSFKELHKEFSWSGKYRWNRSPAGISAYYVGWKEGRYFRVYDVELKKSDYFKLENVKGIKELYPFQHVGETLSSVHFDLVTSKGHLRNILSIISRMYRFWCKRIQKIFKGSVV